MAAVDKQDDTTNCPVCFEVYTEEEGLVPRLLPCTHTVCERCIKQLLQGEKQENRGLKAPFILAIFPASCDCFAIKWVLNPIVNFVVKE